MSTHRDKLGWLAIGLALGFCLTNLGVWPHETVHAETADRSDKFVMFTVQSGVFNGGVDSIFILDFLTGQLVGASLDPASMKFTRFYYRNIAADFGVNPRSRPVYAIASGDMPFAATGKLTLANGVIYVAELTSGKVAAYAYPYDPTTGTAPPVAIAPVDIFPFREVTPAN